MTKRQSGGKALRKETRASSPVCALFPIELEGFDSLAELALDMRYYWNHRADGVWSQLAPALWEVTYNPRVGLQTVSREGLHRVSADPAFRRKVDYLL